MKIDRTPAVTTTSNRRSERNRSSKGVKFSDALSGGEESPSAASVSGGGALGPVDALLSLQEVSGDLDGRSKGRRRGEDLLDQLDELRLGLLDGNLSPARVEKLVDLVASKRGAVDDPRLIQILDEIELRAAVELAKLGR